MQTFIPFPWFPGIEAFYLPGRQEVPVVLQIPSCYLLVVNFDLISSIGTDDQSIWVSLLIQKGNREYFSSMLDIFRSQALNAPPKIDSQFLNASPHIFTNTLHHNSHFISLVNPLKILSFILLSTHSSSLP